MTNPYYLITDRSNADASRQSQRQNGERATVKLRSSNPTPRSLLVDDDSRVLPVAAGGSVRMGFDVQTATNGLRAPITSGE